MSNLLESLQQGVKGGYQLSVSVLGHHVVGVVPQVGGRTADDPRLVESHTKLSGSQESLGGGARQVLDEVTVLKHKDSFGKENFKI